MRSLPLKTLFVYIDMENIIKPKYTYFANYSFKYNEEPENIIGRFKGERERFVTNIIDNCDTKKTWTYVDMDELTSNQRENRKRVITALEYFDEKGWIELHAKQSIEVYEIKNQNFDIDEITEKIYNLFKTKEENGIKRIDEMISFFEKDSCISKELAEYFNETLKKDKCGHCSHCKNGKITIEFSTNLKSLDDFDFELITADFRNKIGRDFSISNVTKFLCGIYTPLFSKLKIKFLPKFGILEKYCFGDVKNWISKKI
jgi:ATP-dependent DNA helicase RecQ